MDSSSLLRSIAQHRDALADLSGRVDGLLAAVDAATASARDVLGEYQDRKRLASESLGQASRQFEDAQLLLRQADDLFGSMAAVKEEHVRLSGHANGFIAAHGDSEATRRVHREATTARHTLRDLYRRINRARQDAGLVDTDAEPSAPAASCEDVTENV